MAFQFLPPFNEGDKQTNPETKVEYIFTDGAWRPLGPSIEDEFNTLDGRYIKSGGTTVLDDFYRLRGPNVAGDGTSTFQRIDEGVQKLYNIATPSKTNTGWVANVEYVNNEIEALDSASIEYVDNAIEAIDSATVTIDNNPPENPTTGDLWFHSGEADLKIYYTDNSSSQWVPASTPPDPYDENFVSTSGDTMTGTLKLQPDSTSTNMMRFINPNNERVSRLYLESNTTQKLQLDKGCEFKIVSHGNDGTTYPTAGQCFKVYQSGTCRVERLAYPSVDHHAASKKYVDDEIAKIPFDDRPQGLPGTRYKYSDSYDNSLPDGCFHITGAGEVQMSRKSFDGIEMSSYQTDDFTADVRGHCHVRGADGRVLHSLVFSHYYQGVGTNQRIRLNVSSRVRNGKGDMVAGTIYYITDGIFNF